MTIANFTKWNVFASIQLSCLSIACFAINGCSPPVPPVTNRAVSKNAESVNQDFAVPSVSVASTESKAVSKEPSQSPRDLDAGEIASPSAEELAAWKSPTFEQFQLTEYRALEGSGFVSNVQSVLNGDALLTWGTSLTLSMLNGQDAAEKLLANTVDETAILSLDVAQQKSLCVLLQRNGTLRLWDLTTRREIQSTTLTGGSPYQASISPDGRVIAVLSRNQNVEILDIETWKKTAEFKIEAGNDSTLKFISPTSFVTTGNSTKLWDANSGTLLQTYPALHYQNRVALSNDANLWTLLNDNQLEIKSTVSDKHEFSLHGIFGRDERVSISPDNKWLASLNATEMRVWNIETARLAQVLDLDGSSTIDAVWGETSNTLALVSDLGVVRIWSRGVASADLSPSSGNASLVGGGQWEKRTPACYIQNLVAIDFRLLPLMPGTTPVAPTFNSLSCKIPAKTDTVEKFYAFQLQERGWKEVENSKQAGLRLFSKDDHFISMTTYSAEPDQSFVNLNHHGNFLPASLPRVGWVEGNFAYESVATCIYTSSLKLPALEIELLRALHQVGWTATSHLKRGSTREGDTRQFSFFKNGSELTVMVQPSAQNSDMYTVNYNPSLTAFSIPIPSDSGVVEINDFLDSQLVAVTDVSIDETVKFYDREMKAQGWVALQKGRKVTDSECWLPYFQDQRSITIGITKTTLGQVLVQAGKYSDSSWQLRALQATDSSKDETAANSDDGVTNDKMEAADFPVFEAQSAVKADPKRNTLEFTLKKDADLVVVHTRTKEALQKLGWEVNPIIPPSSQGFNSTAQKGDSAIYFTANVDPLGEIQATIHSTAFLWEKKLGTSGVLVSYETWLRNNNSIGTLKRLGEYEKEMAAIK